MAYNRRKIAAYGGVGVVIATIITLALIWAPFQEVVGLVPIVELESVTDGTLAITVITDVQVNVIQLNITIDRLEVKPLNGSWTEVEIPGERVSFDLLRRQGTFIEAVISQLEPGSMIRMLIVQGFEYANATLNNGDVVGVVFPSEEIEAKTPIGISQRVYIIKS